MAGNFSLRIKPGNAEMQDPSDVAELLAELAEKLGSMPRFGTGDSGALFDANGNTVGRWETE